MTLKLLVQLGIVALAALVLALILGAGLLVSADVKSHPDVEIPEENRHQFARVAILMDGTRSVGEDNFEIIKEIIEDNIIPGLGIDDVAAAFDVQATNEGRRNEVFGLSGEQLPQALSSRREILETLERNRQSVQIDEPMYELLRELGDRQEQVKRVRQTWIQLVRERQAPEKPGSDICTTLMNVGNFLSRGETDEERWLFVLSDLQNESPAKACPGKEPFPETRVVLIYPLDSDEVKRQRVEGFWQGLLGDQPLDRVAFSAITRDTFLIPPNPLEGLPPVKSTWEHARPLLGRFVLGWLGGTLLLGLIAAPFVWRRRGAERSGP